ncbi:uncharacterized protein LOC111196664 [Astyanax mexicanus]|uniref:uncharacterized protein LOC111196664 n=1 Tax=Astyanax mexicanus TaxID=7994 RepID=UPI0020CB4D60|nr:uncharacterized protein LOC111196664 [Astyanax mexicanus]
MIRALIWTCLLLCAMVHITVCCNNDKEIHCPNITATVGENITLTCNVSKNGNCDKYKWIKNETKNGTCEKYKWKKNETNLTLEAKNCSSVNDRKFNYTIKNASMTDNGTYKFWIQLNTSPLEKCFIVNISGSPIKGDPTKDPRVMAAIITTSGIILGLIIAFAVYCSRRRKNIQHMFVWDSLGPIRTCPDPIEAPCTVRNPDGAPV